MWLGITAFRSLPSTVLCIMSVVACTIWFWPTATAGALSHAPMQGASISTSSPRLFRSSDISSFAPDISQVMELHTRIVISGERSSVFKNIEMMIERRSFKYLCQGQLKFLGQRHQMIRTRHRYRS